VGHDDVAVGHLRFHDIVQAGVLRMGRGGRLGADDLAAKHLVAGPRLHKPLVEAGMAHAWKWRNCTRGRRRRRVDVS
jgi:hypothetical protein